MMFYNMVHFFTLLYLQWNTWRTTQSFMKGFQTWNCQLLRRLKCPVQQVCNAKCNSHLTHKCHPAPECFVFKIRIADNLIHTHLW